jgi:hypothetical protein
MLARLIVMLCVCGGVMVLPGCKINSTASVTTSPEIDNKVVSNKNSQPSPKPRPKSEPIYPPSEHVIAWHANQCGDLKLSANKNLFIGEQQLKSFFRFMCSNIRSDPNTVMNKLVILEQMFFWPDAIKQYLWLQKQHIALQVSAKKEQQALTDKMQQTLSSLAAIEQQLLLREDTKEQ